jgi:hypothetical protein
MNRILGFLALFAFAACMACSSSKSPAGPDASTDDSGGSAGDDGSSEASLAADGGAIGDGAVATGPSIHWMGRMDFADAQAPRFAWSGTGLVANVSGTSISVKLKTSGASADSPIYFQTIVDDAGTRFAVPNGEQTVTLASNLPDAGHTVQLYRDTEGKYGISTFEGFTDGVLQSPPPSSGRLIEVVGDSISAGFGDLGAEQHPNYGPDPDGGCPFSTATESAYVTYGAKAAQTLGADWSILALSGWGMYRDNANNMANVMPLVYANTLGTVASPAWPFQPEPQAVIINLGTNDFNNGDPGQMQFEGAYTAFLGTVRSKYPDAWVFCTVGPLLFGNNLASAQVYIQDVVSMAQAGGDTKVQYLDFGQQNTTLGTGCQYHPNVPEHTAMAATLVAALHSALGW